MNQLFMEESKNEFLSQLFSKEKMDAPTEKNIAIIGGGLSGMLLALKLSHQSQVEAASISLIESASHLGGRTFFSYPHALSGKNHQARFEAQWATLTEAQSGFGYEAFGLHTAEVVERHLMSHLTEEEQNFVEQFTSQNPTELNRKCYFYKKEFVPFEAMLTGVNEILSRKEAETLSAFIHNVSSDSDTIFEKSEFWVELPKVQKESLTPLLETVLDGDFLNARTHVVLESLKSFYESFKTTECLPQLSRGAGIELALELVLRNRGVKVRTSCTVLKLLAQDEKTYRLVLGDEVNPSAKELIADAVVVTSNLSSSFTYIPRDFYSPAQSRWASRMKPQSLVAVEFHKFDELKSESIPEEICPGSMMMFLSERSKGYLNSGNNLILFTYLDYENSLQAPSVREAVHRLRKLAGKIFNPKAAKTLEPGMRMPDATTVAERVVLMPVAHAAPVQLKGSLELKEVKMGRANLYTCGDHFSFDPKPWKNVVDSVHEVSAQLLKTL